MFKKLTTAGIVIMCLALLIGVVSVTVVSPYMSSPDHHQKQIEQIDDSIETVLKLTAGSAAASGVVSLLPGDSGTPIANKLADLSSAFLVVLCALYAEKYLLTIGCYAVFTFFIPLICLLVMLSMIWNPAFCNMVIKKLSVVALVLFLAIPFSLKISDMINDTYEASITATMDEAENAVNELNQETEEAESSSDEEADEQESTDGQESKGFFSSIISSVESAAESATETISGAAVETLNKFESLITKYIEALAVMIVTSCIIPVLVIFIMFWFAKIMLENMGIQPPRRPRKAEDSLE